MAKLSELGLRTKTDIDPFTALLEAAGGCIGVVAAVVVLALAYAWLYQLLWTWFVVPLGAPVIGYAHAYGLALVLAVTKTYYTGEDKRSTTEKAATGIVLFVVTLLSAVIAHWFMVSP